MPKIKVDRSVHTREDIREETERELESIRSSLANAIGRGRIAECDQPYALYMVGALEAGGQQAWDSDSLITDIALTEERLKVDPSNAELQEELDRRLEALRILQEKEKGSDTYRFISSEATTLDIIDDARIRVLRRNFDRGDRSMFDGIDRTGDTEAFAKDSKVQEFLEKNGFDEDISEDPEFVEAMHIFLGAKEKLVTSRVEAHQNKSDQNAERQSQNDHVIARFAIRNLKGTLLEKVAGKDPEKQKELLEKHYGFFGVLDQDLRAMIEKESGDRKYSGDTIHEMKQAAWNYIQEDWKNTRKGFKLVALATVAGTVGATAATTITPFVVHALFQGAAPAAAAGVAAKFGSWYLPYRIARGAAGSSAVASLMEMTGLGKILTALDQKISSAIEPLINRGKVKKATEGKSIDEFKNALFDKQEKDCAKEAESFVLTRGIKRFLTFVGKNPLRTGLSGLLGYELAVHADAVATAALDAVSPPAEAAELLAPHPETRNHVMLRAGGGTPYVGIRVLEHGAVKLTPANIDDYSGTALQPEDPGKAIIYVTPEWSKAHPDAKYSTFSVKKEGKIYELHKVVLVDAKTNKGLVPEPFIKANGETWVKAKNGKWDMIERASEPKTIPPPSHPVLEKMIDRSTLPQVEPGKPIEFTKDKMIYLITNAEYKKNPGLNIAVQHGQQIQVVSSAWLARNGEQHFNKPVVIVEDDKLWKSTLESPKNGLIDRARYNFYAWQKKLPSEVIVKPLNREIIAEPPPPKAKPWVVPEKKPKVEVWPVKRVPQTAARPEPLAKPSPKPQALEPQKVRQGAQEPKAPEQKGKQLNVDRPKAWSDKDIPTPPVGRFTVVATPQWFASHREFTIKGSNFDPIQQANAPYAVMKFTDGRMLVWDDNKKTWGAHTLTGGADPDQKISTKKPIPVQEPKAQKTAATPEHKQKIPRTVVHKEDTPEGKSRAIHKQKVHEATGEKAGRAPEDHVMFKALGEQFGGEVRKTLGLSSRAALPPTERGALLRLLYNLKSNNLIHTEGGKAVITASPEELRRLYTEARTGDHSTADAYAKKISPKHWRDWFDGEEHPKKTVGVSEEAKGKSTLPEKKASHTSIQDTSRTRSSAPVAQPAEIQFDPSKGIDISELGLKPDTKAFIPPLPKEFIVPPAASPVAAIEPIVIPGEHVPEGEGAPAQPTPQETPKSVAVENKPAPAPAVETASPKEVTGQPKPTAESKPTAPAEQALTDDQRYARLLVDVQKKYSIPPRFMESVDDRTMKDFMSTIATMLETAKKTNSGELTAFTDEGSLSPLLKGIFAQSLEDQDFVLPNELTSTDYHHLVLLYRILESKQPTLLDNATAVKDFLLKKEL